MKSNWLHGDLPEDDTFRGEWALYFAMRLTEGIFLAEAASIGKRLIRVVCEKFGENGPSINAAADLVMFGSTLQFAATEFARQYPQAKAFNAQVPLDVDLADLTIRLMGVFDSDAAREKHIIFRYWLARSDAERQMNQCRDPETILSWTDLWGAAIHFLLLERVVSRWMPASRPDGSGPTEPVARLFVSLDQDRLERMDAELEEAFADIFTSMVLYWNDTAQENCRARLFQVRRQDERLAARALLREWRQAFEVAPWNYVKWDAELSSKT